MSYLPTGFENLDALIEGVQPTDVMIIADPPSVCPASLAMSMVWHLATHGLCRVGIVSFAMNKYQVVQRLLAISADIDLYHLRTGWITDDEHIRLAQAARMLSRTSIWIDDRVDLTPVQLLQRARQLTREHGVTLLLIDGVHLLQLHRAAQGDGQDVQEMRRNLKALAHELHIPIIVVLPMPQPRVHHRPRDRQHDDLWGRSVAHDDRHVLFLYRDTSSPSLAANKGVVMVTVTIVKHRNGLVTEVALAPQAAPHRT
jgi:replicative DNA helicase